jgi:hypothetical protein
MTHNNIMSDDQLLELKCDLINELLKKMQKAYDNYPIKSKHDKFKCVICGGSYTRHKKTTHYKTKKHIKSLHNIYKKIIEIIK